MSLHKLLNEPPSGLEDIAWLWLESGAPNGSPSAQVRPCIRLLASAIGDNETLRERLRIRGAQSMKNLLNWSGDPRMMVSLWAAWGSYQNHPEEAALYLLRLFDAEQEELAIAVDEPWPLAVWWRGETTSEVWVSQEDWWDVGRYHWWTARAPDERGSYVSRSAYELGGHKSCRLSLHRQVTGLGLARADKRIPDHLGERWDNRRSRLRIVPDQAANAQNQRSSGATSSWRGVSQRGNRWRAAVTHQGVTWTKEFSDELSAAWAASDKRLELMEWSYEDELRVKLAEVSRAAHSDEERLRWLDGEAAENRYLAQSLRALISPAETSR